MNELEWLWDNKKIDIVIVESVEAADKYASAFACRSCHWLVHSIFTVWFYTQAQLVHSSEASHEQQHNQQYCGERACILIGWWWYEHAAYRNNNNCNQQYQINDDDDGSRNNIDNNSGLHSF